MLVGVYSKAVYIVDPLNVLDLLASGDGANRSHKRQVDTRELKARAHKRALVHDNGND